MPFVARVNAGCVGSSNFVVAVVATLFGKPSGRVPVLRLERQQPKTNDPIRDDDWATPSDRLPDRLPRWTKGRTDEAWPACKRCDPNAIVPFFVKLLSTRLWQS
eukprot:scaffold3529_cov271-Amphora_coffeaeformis.AAC.8